MPHQLASITGRDETDEIWKKNLEMMGGWNDTFILLQHCTVKVLTIHAHPFYQT